MKLPILVTTAIITIMPYYAMASDGIVDALAEKKDEKVVSGLPSELPGIEEKPHMKKVQEVYRDSSIETGLIQYAYNPNQRYNIRLRKDMKALFLFPEEENILSFQLGEKSQWIAQEAYADAKTKWYVKPQAAGLDNTLHAIGASGKVYTFLLESIDHTSLRTPHSTIRIGFSPDEKKPFPYDVDEEAAITDHLSDAPHSSADTEESFEEVLTQASRNRDDYIKSLPNYGERKNTSYVIKSNSKSAASIAPHGVYDDGNWTYFDYRNKHGVRIPAVKKVVNGVETDVNWRFENHFLIAESLSNEGFSLINGDDHICIKPDHVTPSHFWNVTLKDNDPKDRVVQVKKGALKSFFNGKTEYTYPGKKKFVYRAKPEQILIPQKPVAN